MRKGWGFNGTLLNNARPVVVTSSRNLGQPGTPGAGLVLAGDADAQRERVYEYPWYSIYPPTEEEFLEANVRGMPDAP